MESENKKLKSSLEEIAVDDYIIYSASKSNGYELKKVTKVTKTQIHVNNRKFRKSGTEITHEIWHKDNIFAPLDRSYSGEYYVDIYRKQRLQVTEQRKIAIESIKNTDFTKVSLATMQKVIELLKG